MVNKLDKMILNDINLTTQNKVALEDLVVTWRAYVCNNKTNKIDNKLFDVNYIDSQREENLVDLANEIRNYIIEDKDLNRSLTWLTLTESIFDEEHNIRGIRYLNDLFSDDYNIVDAIQSLFNMITKTANKKAISVSSRIKTTSITNIIEELKKNYISNPDILSILMDSVIRQI